MDSVDFHIHTVCSNDAYMELKRIAPAAKAAGVIALAPTDHDRVAAVKPLRAQCRDAGLGFFSGVEVDCDDDTGRFGHVHILGLGLDEDDAALNALLDTEVVSGRRRLSAGLRQLEQERGWDLDPGRIRAWWEARVPFREIGPKTVGDYAVARGLTNDRRGAVAMIEDAIRRATPSPHVSPSCSKVIETIHNAKGLAILAHPAAISRDDILHFVRWGIDGLEIYHKNNAGHVERLLGIALELDLAVTGGGDSHLPVQELEPETWPSTAPAELYGKLVERYRAKFHRDPN